MLITYLSETGLERLKQPETVPQGLFNNSHHLIFHHPVMYNINETKEQDMGTVRDCMTHSNITTSFVMAS